MAAVAQSVRAFACEAKGRGRTSPQPPTMKMDKYMKETEMKQEVIDTDQLLRRLLARPTFQWDNSEPATIEQVIKASSQAEARKQITLLNKDSQLTSSSVMDKVTPRAASWQFQDLLTPYRQQQFESLEEFLIALKDDEDKIKAAIEQYSPEDEVDKSLANNQWVVNTLSFEVRSAIKRKAQSIKEKDRLKAEALDDKIRKMKNIPDEQYGDSFNKAVCIRLDELEASGGVDGQSNKLAFTERLIKQELLEGLDNIQLEEYLQQKISEQKKKKITNSLQKGIELLGDSEKALKFTGLMFELNIRQTDQTWNLRKFEEVIVSGLRGENINLISMLCCINQFDYQGSYTLVPELNAYQSNPNLEPIPLIIDEMAKVVELFKFYGLGSRLTMYVADTDYTEIGQYGEVTEDNLKNLSQYLTNLKRYLARYPDVTVLPISEITSNNQMYQEVKARVLANVKSFKDTDFSREWYGKFEDAFERVTESQIKKRLFPDKDIRKKSLDVTRNIWAVNAAQGAIFSSLGLNTVLLSTERRDRDKNYVIDKSSRANFPPVLYVLSAAEMWNRKLIRETD